MKARARGFRAAVVGASSLLGRELRSVLRERHFPLVSLAEIDGGAQPAPDLPIVDLDESAPAPEFGAEARGDSFDVAFIAARPKSAPLFMRSESARPAALIDMDAGLAELGHEPPRIAFLDAPSKPAWPGPQAVAAAHAATIVIGGLLLRLAQRAPLSTAVANVFSPASLLGARAIEEMQRQTVNLLSFQKIPRTVYGAQLAFNLLPQVSGSGSAALEEVETRVRGELERYLAGRAVPPAIRFFQAPVFYSIAISLYVETADRLSPEDAAAALAGGPVRMRRASGKLASPVDVTGTADISLQAIRQDPSRERGLWIWAAADDLRLAALNAVELAEQLTGAAPPARSRGKAR